MKHRFTLPSFLWPWLMAFLLSCGATACLVTAFDLDAPMGQLIFLSLVVSGIFSFVLTHRPQWKAVLALGAGFLLLLALLAGNRDSSLLSSLETMLYRVSRAFDRTYHWGVIRWSILPPTAAPFPALVLVIGLLSLTVSAAVCCRTRSSMAVLLSLIPLLLCMVARDTVPEGWCLWLLFAGLGLFVLTGSVRRMDAMAGRRLTAIVLVPTLLASSVLFWILPPSEYETGGLSSGIVSWIQSLPFWSDSPLGSISYTGDEALAEVDLSRLGNREDTTDLAMTVVSSQSGRLYLRGRGYDDYDGTIWESTANGSGIDRGWSSPKAEYLQTVTVTTQSPRQLLYFPGSAGVDLRETSFLRGLLPNQQSQLEYTFSYGIPDGEVSLTDRSRQDFLDLPPQARSGAAAHLAQIMVGVDPADTEAVVLAIEAYVEACAEYSYIPSAMPANATDFAIWFLSEAETGYCVHFATAAAVLLRAAGIPARYVTGYAVDVLAGKEINVWERHAHAWVEYFHPETGWTILDATPGSPGPDPLPTEPPETTAPPETQPPTEDPDSTEPSRETTAPTKPSEVSGPATQGPAQPGTREPAAEMPDWVKTVISWLLAAAAVIALLWGQYRLRIWARRRYLRRGSPNRQALHRYRLIVLRSRLLKTPIPSPITELAEKAKFSQHTLTRAELLELDQHLDALAEELTGNSRFLRFLFAIE